MILIDDIITHFVYNYTLYDDIITNLVYYYMFYFKSKLLLYLYK